MEYIAHRINTIEELKQVPKEFGVELDLRDFGDKLVLQHDPFKSGEDFEEYLKHYNHGTMILNIKSERIEHKVLELIQKYGIEKYFFLDSSFPMIYLLSKNGEKNIALRFSEFEGIDTILTMKGKVEWIWVDCFSKLPITKENYKLLKDNGFKLCLVSPELQSQPEKLEEYKNYLEYNQILFDSICTKIYCIDSWKKSFK
ncbi:phosphatidylinositol-specific phospholipase C/glycerophosphodiester phosphodiesterase family protein [Halarcobacter sp.]|uniref:phosphatidylinositol-specific phospholipase C/glycerophosphodiester phosphodiesterase family protein n=1 Tax=Halarcobacter sp. TaxID=2321133 RepID=UPI002AA6A626|nr:phosphatidylinositol-specific phospholipase C/glycerophosphodiester phosphodiesterase family protein [Halarcobacter sp.]